MKSVLWRVAKCLSHIEEARCLKVNRSTFQSENIAVRFFFLMHGIGPSGFLKCIDFLYHQRIHHLLKTKDLVTFFVCKCKANICSELYFLWQRLIILRL